MKRTPVAMPEVTARTSDAFGAPATSTIVKVEAVRVEDRARREYSSIDTLAASIESLGLLHPIVVTPELRLVAGGRRLEAVKALGWESVPATIANSLTEAAALLQAESDENTEREPLRPSEAADLARKIEEVLAPLAAKRQEESRFGAANFAGPSAPEPRPREVPAKFAAVSEPRPREVAAKAAGISHESIRKVRVVQEVIESDTTPEPVREIAKAALAQIDESGKVDAGHKKVRTALTASEAVAEFPDLAYYFDKGDLENVVMLGSALRSYREPELTSRLNALRATVAAERRKDAAPAVEEGPDFVALADTIFVAFNNALQSAEKNGGADTIRRAVESANPLAVELWRSQFERIQSIAADLLDATRPVLRRVQ